MRHSGEPNVSRVSCRPDSQEAATPAETFYSRTVPVKCSRWLDGGGVTNHPHEPKYQVGRGEKRDQPTNAEWFLETEPYAAEREGHGDRGTSE